MRTFSVLVLLGSIAALYAARVVVRKGSKPVKVEDLCVRMHNNTALVGSDPFEVLQATAFECQKKCIDMYPACSAVVYYYIHGEKKHHYCYLFEKNSIQEKMDLIEQKPENKKDLVKMLEVVKDCREFDNFPPLDEDGVASSSDHVNRTKRAENPNAAVEEAGSWTDWTHCSLLGHQVRSRTCEYGRKIQRRGCPARQPPQQQIYAQSQQAGASFQQQEADRQREIQERQRAEQDRRRQHEEELRRREEQLRPQPPQQPQPAPQQPQPPQRPYPPQPAPQRPPQSPQQPFPALQQPQPQPQSPTYPPRQSYPPDPYAQQYQRRLEQPRPNQRHPAVPVALPCDALTGLCPPRAAAPTPQYVPPPTQYIPPPTQYLAPPPPPTRYLPAPPPPPPCVQEGCYPTPQVFGEFLEWSEWSICSCTCGDGLKQRRRECPAGNCQGPSIEDALCSLQPCKTWSDWCEWSPCKGSCGTGERIRTRYCELGTQRCEGKDFEVDQCDAGPCPEWAEWEDWTQCTVTCGRGTVSRQRTCLGGVHGNDLCPGSRTEERPCELPPCSYWAAWQEWGACSVTCGDGSKTRNRICQYGDDCIGPQTESLYCFGPPCSAWTEWCEWSPCSASCGPGRRARTRECLTATGEISKDCIGPGQEDSLCNDRGCCSWSDWCGWSQCDRDCGTGAQFRTRVCQREGSSSDRFDDECECPGPDRESHECNLHACAPQCQWTEWCAWSPCSVASACDIGSQQRSRQCVGEAGCHCMGMADESQQCRGPTPCTPKPPC